MPSRRSSPCQRNRRPPPDTRALPGAAMSTGDRRHRLSARLQRVTRAGSPDEGDDVHAQVAGVPGAGLPAHRQRHDLLEPVLEPVLDGDVVEQPGLLPVVAGVLQLADGGVELAPGGAAEVPAVARPPGAGRRRLGRASARRRRGTWSWRCRPRWCVAYRASLLPGTGISHGRTNRSSSVRSTRTERPRCAVRSRRSAIDAAPGPAQLGGGLVEVEQDGGLRAGSGIHTYLMSPGGGFAALRPNYVVYDPSVDPPPEPPAVNPVWAHARIRGHPDAGHEEAPDSVSSGRGPVVCLNTERARRDSNP